MNRIHSTLQDWIQYFWDIQYWKAEWHTPFFLSAKKMKELKATRREHPYFTLGKLQE